MRRETHTPPPRRGRPLVPVLLYVNSGWMLVAAVSRVIIALHQGTLDALPFISFVLGAVGLATLGVYEMRDRG